MQVWRCSIILIRGDDIPGLVETLRFRGHDARAPGPRLPKVNAVATAHGRSSDQAGRRSRYGGLDLLPVGDIVGALARSRQILRRPLIPRRVVGPLEDWST